MDLFVKPGVKKRKNGKTSRLEGVINGVLSKNPHSREVITAFKPLLLARERLLDELKVKPADPSSIDGEKLRQGVPCIDQTPLFFKGDPWKQVGLAVLSAIREGFPALNDDVNRLEEKVKAGDIDLFDAFTEFPGSLDTAVDRWSKEANVKPETAGLLLRSVMRVVLQARSRGIGEHIKETDWEKGYCPVCGAYPTLAVIREKITQRWLNCSRCGHEWRYRRMFCPGCEKESPSGLDYFYVEDRRQETAFTCDSCKRYLITLNHISDIGDHDRDVSAMGLIHLDIIMQEKGYTPMTWCEWNAF